MERKEERLAKTIRFGSGNCSPYLCCALLFPWRRCATEWWYVLETGGCVRLFSNHPDITPTLGPEPPRPPGSPVLGSRTPVGQISRANSDARSVGSGRATDKETIVWHEAGG
jgi:hypothetical protein